MFRTRRSLKKLTAVVFVIVYLFSYANANMFWHCHTICGQCITHCPTGALRERDDTDIVLDALADPDKVTVIQVAPAVRTAWAEYWNLDKKKATPGRMVAAIRKLGFDYVFDTNFSADLTIMEEGTELLRRLKAHASGETGAEEKPLPMFTSNS